MPQTRFAQTVCHFSHNADFDQLRISKYPANAHEINYFSMLVVGSFKYTLNEAGKSLRRLRKTISSEWGLACIRCSKFEVT